MMELDPHYCDVIIARWEKFTGKKAELVSSPKTKPLSKRPGKTAARPRAGSGARA